MQRAGGEEEDSDSSPEAEETESYQKENVEHITTGLEEEEEEVKRKTSDMYRGKQLPPGMKLKKRAMNEEKNSPKGNAVEEADKMKDKSKENHTESAEAEKNISTANVKAVHPEKLNQTSQDPHMDSSQQPADGKTCLEQTDLNVKETQSSPSSSTQATSDDSDDTRQHTPDKPTQSTDSNETEKHQDDDDDVVLVSVKPATEKTPPVSAVQKTLTSFPGFQPASKIKCQQGDPKGLRSLLTVQLQQKKVRLKDVIGCLVKYGKAFLS